MIDTSVESTFWVTYRLASMSEEAAVKLAEKICLEQTVELDGDLVWDAAIRETIVGKIASLEQRADGGFLAKIQYDCRVAAEEVPQFLNVLFGNTSFKQGVQLFDVSCPDSWLKGPKFGMAGIRAACETPVGPLISTALKPMGTSTQDLATMAYELAMGGIHIIKDDHGLANQPFHPFADRVRAVSKALKQARRDSGNRCLYFPNFAPTLEALGQALDVCRETEVPGLLVSPYLVGLDMVRYLRDHSGMMLMLHPAWTGGLFHRDCQGVYPPVLLGKLYRALGGDCSIYPSTGGRFGFSRQTCTDLNHALRDPWGTFLPSFPVPAGGMSLPQIPGVLEAHGQDLILLIGSGLYRVNRDLRQAVRAFRKAAGI